MEKAKILEQLIKESGLSVKAFAEKSSIPYTTLYSILKRGVGKASVDTIIQICHQLGITVEELEEMATGKKVERKPVADEIKQLVARNGKEMSQEDKMELIKMLSNLD